MSDEKVLIAVSVKSTSPDGYRRAGFGLNHGENQLEVTEAQLAQLQADCRLAVTLSEEEAPDNATDDSKTKKSKGK